VHRKENLFRTNIGRSTPNQDSLKLEYDQENFISKTDLQTPKEAELKATGSGSSISFNLAYDDSGLSEAIDRLVVTDQGTPQSDYKKSVVISTDRSNPHKAPSKIDQILFSHDEGNTYTDSKIAASYTQKISSSQSNDIFLEEELKKMISGVGKIAIGAESDASPSSSDEEYGAKTLIRKVRDHVSDIENKSYAINELGGTEEITQEEIQENLGKYYVANFRGDYLKYFSTNAERRRYVREAVESTTIGKPLPYKSIAIKSIEKKYSDPEKVKQEFNKLETPRKLLQNSEKIKSYKAPNGFKNAVDFISPDHGNPTISTSKDVKVSPVYADHVKEGKVLLHPKYSEDGKSKHRLIGITSVIVHEANEYLKRIKSDMEKLRRDGFIGGISAVERDNQEILFDGIIGSSNMAGYVPLAYPNLSKMKKIKGRTK